MTIQLYNAQSPSAKKNCTLDSVTFSELYSFMVPPKACGIGPVFFLVTITGRSANKREGQPLSH